MSAICCQISSRRRPRSVSIPGVAIGVWGRRSGSPRVPRRDKRREPAAVDPDALYVLGSVTKPPH